MNKQLYRYIHVYMHDESTCGQVSHTSYSPVNRLNVAADGTRYFVRGTVADAMKDCSDRVVGLLPLGPRNTCACRLPLFKTEEGSVTFTFLREIKIAKFRHMHIDSICTQISHELTLRRADHVQTDPSAVSMLTPALYLAVHPLM